MLHNGPFCTLAILATTFAAISSAILWCKLLEIPQGFQSPVVYTPRNRAWNRSKNRQCKRALTRKYYRTSSPLVCAKRNQEKQKGKETKGENDGADDNPLAQNHSKIRRFSPRIKSAYILFDSRPFDGSNLFSDSFVTTLVFWSFVHPFKSWKTSVKFSLNQSQSSLKSIIKWKELFAFAHSKIGWS